MYCRGMTI